VIASGSREQAEAGTPDAVRMEGVRFTYPGRAAFRLAIDELAIAAGERVACIGPSGSGKTTLIHLVTGIARPDAGRVLVGGTDLADLSESARRARRIRHVGLVFQQFELVEYLSGLDNILLPHLVGRDLRADRAARDRARGLAEQLGIGDLLRRLPRACSQGEQQRIAIARALVTEPALVIADEPTGNLDPATAGRMLDLLFAQVEARDATLLVVTHDHGTLGRFDRVIDMDRLRSPVPPSAEEVTA